MNEHVEAKTPKKSSRFINQPETVSTLAEVQNALDGFNLSHSEAAHDNNPRSATHPYEGAVFFNIDSRPSNRATAVAHSPFDGFKDDPRLDFFDTNIKDHRVILSQTALGEALKEKSPSFMTSRMNPNQRVWSHPLEVGGVQTSIIQFADTTNVEEENWTYTGNDEADKIWDKHKITLTEAARALASLALKTTSLSKTLEKAPPVAFDSWMLSWDVINSTPDVLSKKYPTHEAYLEAWKARRNEITEAYGAKILDRGDGEHIILPLFSDPYSDYQTKSYANRIVQPLAKELLNAHAEIADDFMPTIFRRINIGVGVGNIEEDQDGNPTGQVVTEVESLRDGASEPIFYTPTMKSFLDETK